MANVNMPAVTALGCDMEHLLSPKDKNKKQIKTQ